MGRLECLPHAELKTFPRTPLKMERVYLFRKTCGIGNDRLPAGPQELFQTLENG